MDNTTIKTIKIRCEDCNGEMTIDSEKNVIICPFCGSKRLIIDDKDVAIEKIRNNSIKDTNDVRREELKLQQQQFHFHKEQMKYERSREINHEFSEKFKKGKLQILLMIIAFFSFMSALQGFGHLRYGFKMDEFVSAAFCLCQFIFTMISLLIGYEILPQNKLMFALTTFSVFIFGFLAMLTGQ